MRATPNEIEQCARAVLAADCEKAVCVCCEIKSSVWRALLILSFLCHAHCAALRLCVESLLGIDDRRIDFSISSLRRDDDVESREGSKMKDSICCQVYIQNRRIIG